MKSNFNNQICFVTMHDEKAQNNNVIWNPTLGHVVGNI